MPGLLSSVPQIVDARTYTLSYFGVTVTTKTTAAAVTFTAAEILGGIVVRDPNGAARADLMPTAAQIIAAINGPFVGLSFEFQIRNSADAAETITVTTNTGVTLSGTMTIAQSNSKWFQVVITAIGGEAGVAVGGDAVTIYANGTFTT